jgi:GTP-binding protein
MKKPVVVIVGRPNVGKSTLFNRLIGARNAIVDDISGVTRDRNYGEVEWDCKEFILIDTGGYVPDTSDVFETAIREQVQMGIDESDKIILLVDAKQGVTPVDREISQLIRNSGKECLLVVNKVDSENLEYLASEFYEMGIGEPFSLSAMVGRKTGDFLELLTKDFHVMSEATEDTRLKIAVVGRPNVGKSSLTNALLGYDRNIVTDVPGTTRDSIDSVLKYHGEEIVLIDTAGLRKRSKIDAGIEFFSSVRTLKAIGSCDITIVLLDSMIGLEKQDQKIIDEAERRKKGIIIAVNKWDLIEKDDKTAHQLEKQLKVKLGNLDYLPVVFISALQKQRVYKLIEMAKQLESRRKIKIPTSELNDKLLAVIQATPPPVAHTGKEVKIKYITQGGEHYPIFFFFANYPKQIPEHYRRFLENTIRKLYDFSGVPLTLLFKEK